MAATSERRLTRSPIATLIYGALSAFALVSGCSCGDDPDPPPAGDKPVIKNFTANPAMVASGGKTTLTWEVLDADKITIVAAPGGTLVENGTALTGSIESAALTALTAFKIGRAHV
jgi:hypothetical protein